MRRGGDEGTLHLGGVIMREKVGDKTKK